MPELMIAGPGELHETDLHVVGRQVIAHYGDVWTKIHTDTVATMGRFLGASDLPYLIPGTGTTCRADAEEDILNRVCSETDIAKGERVDGNRHEAITVGFQIIAQCCRGQHHRQ